MEVKLFFLFIFCATLVNCEIKNENIGCKFETKNIVLANSDEIYYGCSLSYTKNINNEELHGEHQPGKNDDDVIFVQSQYRKSPLPREFSLNVCKKFKNLKKIGIYRKNIEVIKANILDDCLNLKDFTFVDNNVREVPQNLFSKSNKLKIIDLQNNHLEILPANLFESLAYLENLFLGRNNIKALNPEWFKNLPNLKVFSADRNEISELQKDIFMPLKNLVELHLYNNNLTIIHSDSFYLPSKLEVLSLNHNKIKAIDRKLLDESVIRKVTMYPNVCNNSNMVFREETLMGLKKCFNNYQPRD